MRGTWIAVAAVLGVISFYFQSGGTALAYDNCSTANADICINVGETAKIKVTNRLLQTFCVDSHGNPDDELVTLNVSGEPDTGGAGAIFDPEIIRAYSEFSILSLHTTLGTKPGNYTIDIGGTGTHCGRYHGYRTFLLVRPTVDGPSALWSFNGAKPAGYRTEITFTAQPANLPPYNWYVPATSVLRFSNNSSFITTTTNKAKLHAIRPTRSIDHPTIFISVKGGLSLDHEIKVRTPAELELIPPPRHVDDGRLGYRSVWEYLLLDQYGDPLPGAQLPVEVAWTPGPTKIFRNTNWERPARGPKFTADPHHIRFRIFPLTDGGSPATDGIPRAQHPRGGSTKIDCWKAVVYVGGDLGHPGVKVDTQTWLRYRDHATTEATSCP